MGLNEFDVMFLAGCGLLKTLQIIREGTNMKSSLMMVLLLAGLAAVKAQEKMTPELLQETIKALAEEVTAEGSTIQFSFKGVPMILIYDEQADRMRLVAPIIETKNLEEGMLEKAMEANYHSALDARYAISNDIVWSVFIHPLSDLRQSFFKSAILQVATARATFGDAYTSGALLFGVNQDEDVI